MYIKDGSSKDYSDNKDSYVYLAKALVRANLGIDDYEKLERGTFGVHKRYKNLYMWGWLGDKVITSGGFSWDSKALKNRIVKFLKNYPSRDVVDHYCGFHTCEICGDMSKGFEGSIKIKYNDKVYCCPRGVEHYIEEHDYCPPDEVIMALLEGTPVTPKMMVAEIVQTCRNKILKEMEKEREQMEIQREAVERRKECEERRMRLFSPHQRELIVAARNGGGDFVPLES